METRTASVALVASRRVVFDWLSRIENVPAWATEFVQAFEVTGESEARARTAMGDVLFRLEAEPACGVIDIFVAPAEGEPALFPTRVVPLGADGSIFLFTMFRGPDMEPATFEEQYASLERELDGLRERFG